MVAQNIDTLCFHPKGVLRNEYNELYNALFTHSESYIKVVELLYRHKDGLTCKEIREATNFSGKTLAKILRNLEMCSFIAKRELYKKESTMVYRLVDFYTRFYFKFIQGKHKLDSQWWSHHLYDAGVKTWTGLTFELICMQHYPAIKKALGINGIATEISTWRCEPDKKKNLRGTQIDMVIERADRIIHLCEMKFSEDTYNLDRDYADYLRARAENFRTRTKNKKAVVHTFITTYGVGTGKHYGIVHSEVTMDDLFQN